MAAVATNGLHFVGACALGEALDGDLKVLGFSNLRVVDASAIPNLPPGAGPASSVYLVAEHIAARIVEGVTGKGREDEGCPEEGYAYGKCRTSRCDKGPDGGRFRRPKRNHGKHKHHASY
jgi:hypothetical protein